MALADGYQATSSIILYDFWVLEIVCDYYFFKNRGEEVVGSRPDQSKHSLSDNFCYRGVRGERGSRAAGEVAKDQDILKAVTISPSVFVSAVAAPWSWRVT